RRSAVPGQRPNPLMPGQRKRRRMPKIPGVQDFEFNRDTLEKLSRWQKRMNQTVQLWDEGGVPASCRANLTMRGPYVINKMPPSRRSTRNAQKPNDEKH
ncbi:MAG: hypothetical protein AAGJ35_06405, partial [Myxococcota bacterium]